MARRNQINRKKDMIREIQRLRKFLQDLRWLISDSSKIDLKSIEEFLEEEEQKREDNESTRIFSSFAPENTNTRMLVGVLPAILTDSSIFKSNEEIAGFSEKALGLIIPRWEKKSKNEIIGHIVCNAGELNDEELNDLVKALTRIVSGDKEARQVVKTARTAKLDWNTIIQRLTDA